MNSLFHGALDGKYGRSQNQVISTAKTGQIAALDAVKLMVLILFCSSVDPIECLAEVINYSEKPVVD